MAFLHLKISRSFLPFKYLFQVRPEKYLRHLNLSFTDQILEFGCGAGLSSSYFNPKNYIGVDVDAERIKFAENINKKYRYKQINGAALPFNNEEFDHILVIGVFHHISNEDINKNLNELARVLKFNKSAIVIEPCLTNSFIRNLWMKKVDRGLFIRREEEYTLFFQHNFEVEVLDRFSPPSLFRLSTFRLTKKT